MSLRLKIHCKHKSSTIFFYTIVACHVLNTYAYTSSSSNSNNVLLLGPSDQPEAYFNGTSYVRLQNTISLKKQTGLSFRTCSGGELFSQQLNDNLIELSVDAQGVTFTAKAAGRAYKDTIIGNFLNNKWHLVFIQYRMGNLTLQVDTTVKLIANGSSYRSELLTNPDLYNDGAVLIVGNHYSGCILEGPSIVFNSSFIHNHDVQFKPCPILDDSCSVPPELKVARLHDYCTMEPCMRHGTCLNGQTTYTCNCLPRYTGKNCEIDMGNPCEKVPSPCKNSGTCSEDITGDYRCNCLPEFTGKNCEHETRTHPFCANSPCLNGGTCQVDDRDSTAIKAECVCPAGFIGSKCEINFDECQLNPCKNYGSCSDGVNNFTCDCSRTGYTGINCEHDVNECASFPCLNRGICFNTYGSYLCQCMPGFEGSNCQFNTNECLSRPCLNRGVCSHTQNGGSYSCRCLSGFGGDHCEIELRQSSSFCDENSCLPYGDCVDVGSGVRNCICKIEYPGIYPNCSTDDICAGEPCKNGGTCSMWKGSYNCTCLAGFVGSSCERPEMCPCRNGGTCVKEHLNYRCHCPEGWTGSECEQPLQCVHSPCEHSTSCRDELYGGYHCLCEAGWTGPNCNMELPDYCLMETCLNGGTCFNHLDSYGCLCAAGYGGKNCSLNIDECASSPCLNGGVCVDGVNSFYCNCTEQWMGQLCEKLYDACELKLCSNNATCITTSPDKRDFTCTCLPGFEGDRCEINTDDCAEVTCPVGKVCVDLVSDYECSCPLGYTGENCTIDADPCSKEPCANGATCVVNHLTYEYSCVCSSGYTGAACTMDVNECKLPGVKVCQNDGLCVNNEGSFDCYCKPGFTGLLCNIDIDECLSLPCRNNATCKNLINNYECICPPGYAGKDCSVDINECDSMPCMAGSQCVDGVNEFRCVCQAGLTGKLCNINIDDCMHSPCLNGARCIDGLNNYTCDCTDTGYKGIHCEINIDDCVSNPCKNGARCVDEIKDYRCNCFLGYTGKNCEEDVNECESNPCKYSGICLENSNRTLYQLGDSTLPKLFHEPFDFAKAAGYQCQCVPGITGRDCETNIDECVSSPCMFGVCIDKIGAYFCDCNEGYEGEKCDIDIDECEKYKPCVHGTCRDGKANYDCECIQQFGGKNCSVELIGCASDPCLNNGTCKPYLTDETQHRFNCTCPNGFHGVTCEKITTMSLSKHSLVTVNTSREEGYDIQFRFKTTLSDGLLALGKGGTYYFVELSRGRLNLHSSLLNKWEGVFIGSNLNDSKWQKVFVAINASHLVLSANDEQTIYPITSNDNGGGNMSQTSFPTTYIGGVPSNLANLVHSPYLVGCMEDVTINGERILPDARKLAWLELKNVDVGCQREPQCEPNPCRSGGHCTDKWREFSCTCERPYLGLTCQYNYTAATFCHENITDSLVTVLASDSARRAVRSIVDISMFIRTRQSRGQIFYLGSALGSAAVGSPQDETFIAAQLEGGQLLLRIQLNSSTPEVHTVGADKLDNGYSHLIQVIRNVTLVQVKLNGSECFRKTISATGNLDAQVLYLGGLPQLRSVRQAAAVATATDNTPIAAIVIKNDVTPATGPAVVTTPLSTVHFKGIIQDVQISNGSKAMIVEFFPLQAEETHVPPAFGSVSFEKSAVLEGVHSDDACRENPCQHQAVCHVTWNDYRCECPAGYKGKNCTELEFCKLQKCPDGSTCKNLEDGYECIANASFDGKTPPLVYNFTITPDSIEIVHLESLELTYRTRSWGTILFVKHLKNYFAIFVHFGRVTVEWKIGQQFSTKRFGRDDFKGQWLTLYLGIRDSVLSGGFKDRILDDESPDFVAEDFDSINFTQLFVKGVVYVAGSDNRTFDYRNAAAVVDDYYNNSVTEGFVDSPDIISSGHYDNRNIDWFKGCLSEIRVGKYLLPFFATKEIYPERQYFEEYFDLLPGSNRKVGCVLCYESDCYNGGRCTAPEDTYICQCPAGFTADDCSIDIDECENNLCHNNSTCIDLVGKYECRCLPGYEGMFCERDIDECLSEPCRHGGTCVDLPGAFKCECLEEYVGKQCEALRLITCENQPCREGSTCQDGRNEVTGNNFTCICADGMEGSLCDTAFCIRRQCEYGICNQTGMMPFCQCEAGFTGKFCEINIDDCILPSGTGPCQNGGICIDGINRYDCNCNGTGYTGLLCERDVDECKSLYKRACGDSGICENVPGSYRCSCENHKCGYSCALDDPCLQNPCVHGSCEAMCTDTPDYVCNCDDNFSGKICNDTAVTSKQKYEGVNVLYIVIPIVVSLLVGIGIGLAILINVARSKRATRGTYSPSAQEFCNPRVELDHVLKPPPEERLI